MRITIQDRRAEALAAGFEALAERMENAPVPYDAFCAAFDDFDVKAFCDGERVVGMLVRKDGELHVAVLPEVRGRWLSKRLIRQVFGQTLAEDGKIIQNVAPDAPIAADFTKRVRAAFESLTHDPMTLMAGATVVGGLLSSNAAQSAASQQASAANTATGAQLGMFNTVNAQNAPWRQTGQAALSALSTGLGLQSQQPGADNLTSLVDTSGGAFQPNAQLYASDPVYAQAWNQAIQAHNQRFGVDPSLAVGSSPQEFAASVANYMKANPGYAASVAAQNTQGAAGQPTDSGYFTRQFNNADLNAMLAPNYNFMLNAGQKATTQALQGQTGLISGNTLMGVNNWAQNYAQNAYQNAFNNFQNQRQNIFNNLSTVAGYGPQSNQTTAGAATGMSPGIASTITGAGQAQAAGTVGSANALTGGLTGAASWYALPSLLNSINSGNTVGSLPAASGGDPLAFLGSMG